MVWHTYVFYLTPVSCICFKFWLVLFALFASFVIGLCNWRNECITDPKWLFRLHVVVLAQMHWNFTMWPWIPSGNVASIFYILLCASFCDKNGNLANIHRFLFQMKRKTEDKTLEQHFLKKLKVTCKNSSESELKQEKAIWKVIWVSCALSPSMTLAWFIFHNTR